MVAIFVGMLAAIAITVFLSQEPKAREAAVRSDLHNAVVAEHGWAASHTGFTGSLSGLETQDFRQSPQVTSPVLEAPVSDSANGGFCIEARHDLSTNRFHVSEGSGA